MTRKARPTKRIRKAANSEASEGSLIRFISYTNRSFEQPTRGDLYTLRPGKKRKKWRAGGTTIGILPEDILLDIFDFYRLGARDPSSPWKWHRLAHVCRKWRHVISTSPRRLDLRILCNYGAPIGSILDSWPTLPLFVRHNNPRSTSLPNNVIVALRRPNRVCEIDLVLPSWSMGPIVEAIQEPFQTLECIRITVKNATGPPMLVREAFLGGLAPRLRKIKLDGIAFPFPAIRQVISSSGNNLVELHLSSIANDVHLSPRDLVTSLMALVQLKRLTIGFHFPPSSPSPSVAPPQRTTLPSLTFLEFHGPREYLEEFVARTDFPALFEIDIRLFNDIFFEIPHFSRFIPLQIALGFPTSVFVTHLEEYVSVFIVPRVESSKGYCCLKASCSRLDWQLSFVTQISSQLPLQVLSSVRLLSIQTNDTLPTGEDDLDSTQWLEFFQPFTHVTYVDVLGEKLVPGIVQTLATEDMATEVLPELTSLRLNGYRKSPSVAKAAEKFVATRRRLSGRTVYLTDC